MHITWHDEYDVDVSEIDAQHQDLARLINELNEAVELDMEYSELRKKLLELIENTRIHFDTEEELMRLNAYPHYSEHKLEHDALISYLKDTESRMIMGEKFNFPLNFNISCECFLSHINESDNQLGKFLNSMDIC